MKMFLALVLGVMLVGCAHTRKDDSKVMVCHKGKNMEIVKAALDAHLKHGDTRGRCR